MFARKHAGRFFFSLFLLLLLVSCSTEFAADGALAFQSFYAQAPSIGWTLADLTAIATAIIAVLALPLAAPAISGVTAATGTAIGGLYGVSGAAAAKFGLALLGGSSAALAAALTYSTELAPGYENSYAPEKYSYQKFVESSRKLITLPQPRSKAEQKGAASETGRELAVRALEHFISNDYKAARRDAYNAYKIGKTPSLPAFVLATSMLYDVAPDYQESLNLLRYALGAEPKNPLTPLLFSTYLSRLSYRIKGHADRLKYLDKIDKIAKSLPEDERKLQIQEIVRKQYFEQLKSLQQRVIATTLSEEESARKRRTIRQTKWLIRDHYSKLVGSISEQIEHQAKTLEICASAEGSGWQLKPQGAKYQSFNAHLRQNRQLVQQYRAGEADLVKRIEDFERAVKSAIPIRSRYDIWFE